MTAEQMFTQLVKLRDRAGATHYERVALAAELLRDRAWVAAPDGGGGDENTALDRLEDACFGDLVGVVGLADLLELYRRVPDAAAWQKGKFNFKKMWAELRAKEHPKPANARPAASPQARTLTPPLSFPNLTPTEGRKEYEKSYRTVESQAQKIERLEARVRELEAENARLREELRRVKKAVADAVKVA